MFKRLASEIRDFLVGPISPQVFLEKFLPGGPQPDESSVRPSFKKFQEEMGTYFIPLLSDKENKWYSQFVSSDRVAHRVLDLIVFAVKHYL